MNSEIANILLDRIKDLNWVDKYAGMVRPIVKAEMGTNGTIIKKTFPVACNVTEDDCIKQGILGDLVPNTNYKSVIYFEDGGTSLVSGDARYLECQSVIYLVGWLNGEKLGYEGCGISAMAVLSILKQIIPFFSPSNSGSFVSLKIQSVNEDIKSPAIFSRYSYDESTNQHLMFPFDYFRLRFQVSFKVPLNCIDDFIIIPSQC